MKRLRILVLLVVLVSLFAVPTTMARKDMTGSERVLVHFEPGQKAGVRNALVKANGNIHVELDNHNVIAVTLPTAALNGISHNPNVTLVELDQPRRLMDQDIPYGIEAVQALDVWDANLDGAVDAGAPTGAGVNVCIIDSGIYDGHEDFAGVDIQPLTTPYVDTFCGHGSHVAGTIAAANNDTGVVGVTPGGATLQIVKVFDGVDCAWTYTSKLVQAADYCEAAGADIISMSLGGSSSSRLEERAFNGYYAAGILNIAAAGNDEVPNYSYPASYDSVISVAAVDAGNVKADFSQWNDQVELSAPGVDVMSTVPWISNTFVEVNGVAYSANQIEFAPEGSATGPLVDGGQCLPDTVVDADAWAGKVVLCQRGDASFLEKVQKAQDHGGVAAVIYNNEAGNFLGTLGEEVSGVIPAVSVSDTDGATMVGMAGDSAFVQIEVIRDTTGGYEAWGGTSMATPHVSGVAALIWSAVPDATNAEIREAMVETALPLGVGVPNDEYGYGLVQAAAAIDYLTGGTPDPTPTPVDPTPTPVDPTPTPVPTDTPEPPTPTPTTVPSEIVINAPTYKQRGRNITISWTTNVPTYSSITINGGSTLYSDDALSTSHQVTIKATVTEVYIYAEDASGNTAEAGPFYR